MAYKPGRCRACGTASGSPEQLDHLLCCLADPREASWDKGMRQAGDWCMWCGEPCPDRQSFCSKLCGLEYARDAGYANYR